MADPLYGYYLQSYIVQGARARGLDPAAVLAVAQSEGGFGAPPGNIGDNGTSFGPFQLHVGGRLPSGLSDPATWANTPAGIDYALDGIAKVAKGLFSTAAIANIVRAFEAPADPASEIARASKYYGLFAQEPLVKNGSGLPTSITGAFDSISQALGIAAGAGGSGLGGGAGASGTVTNPGLPNFNNGLSVADVLGAGGNVANALLNPLGAVGLLPNNPLSLIGAAIKAPLEVADFLGKLVDPNFWLRVLEVIGGAILLGGGLFALAKQVGLTDKVSAVIPAPSKAVAAAAVAA